MKTLKTPRSAKRSWSRACTAKALSSAASWTWASPRAWRSSCARWRRWAIPWTLNVRGYELSVRKADAEMIEIA